MIRSGVILGLLIVGSVLGFFDNATSPSARQLLRFKAEHPVPIGLLTIDSGSPVDLRDTVSINSDFFRHDHFLDTQTNVDGKNVPDRIVHPKGQAIWGYFEVTNDVSKYTSADVFNGIGKKTPVLARPSVGVPDKGGSDLGRDLKGFVLKYYTRDGILDFLCLQTQIFAFKDPTDFMSFVHATHRNPKTGLIDATQLIDTGVNRPDSLTALLYLYSDYGVPASWRFMHFYPVHTYELTNKEGERWYVRFNYRTEQGLRNLTNAQIEDIQSTDADYYIRDMYNAIKNKKYPSWRLEMDILSLHDIQTVNYNPFDLTRLWKNGTYHTETIGRLTFNRNSNNQFRDQEQAGFNPANLVPGIPGPVDTVFRARRLAYKDTQNYRIGRNHNKVGVNSPTFPSKNYNRDGHPPVLDNMKDAPTFYPNSFNGPVPTVDDRRPKEYLQILETNAVDLQEAADFYNFYLKDDGARQRLAENLAGLFLNQVTEPVKTKIYKLIKLTDRDLYRRIVAAANKLVKNANRRANNVVNQKFVLTSSG